MLLEPGYIRVVGGGEGPNQLGGAQWESCPRINPFMTLHVIVNKTNVSGQIVITCGNVDVIGAGARVYHVNRETAVVNRIGPFINKSEEIGGTLDL